MKEYSFYFLELWQRIELEVRNLISQKLGESKAKMPLSRLINELITNNLISKNDSSTIIVLLNRRNEIVHGRYELSKSDLASLVNQANLLLHRLRSLTN